MTYRTMSEIALGKIQESILRGVYPPGSHLIPADLERELGVGRVAIREALRELAGVGLVITIPNKGTMVAKAKNKEELREIFEMRVALEGKATEIASQKIEESDIAALEALNEKMAECVLDSKDYFFLNRKFHLDFYQISGWSFLCQIIGMLYDRTLIYRNTFPFKPEGIKSYIDYHHRILEALKRRDGAAAREIMENHVRDGLTHFIERLNQMEDSQE